MAAIAAACRAVGRALGDLVFPWHCLLCESAGPGLAAPFCDSCRAGLLERAGAYRAASCPRCASPVGPFADLKGGCSACRRRPLGFDAALALGPHEAPWRDFVLGLKRERGAFLAPSLASLLVEARRDALGAIPADALVAPIPQHWLRRLSRRYNQAEVLARSLAEATGREARDALRRVKPTPHLVGRGRQARALALRGAFVVRRGVDLKGRTVLLVDDVLTTGATLGSAARALKRAGARRVVAVVVSRES
ncbi:ComF family protein [Planctomyces sp. SH-PL62]|uniref:ComF family protein n=1 Tax=Planctomyces sp. SH-PL62 TaxID=1636152 RepID=UPI00078E1BBD|nr:ComF family protein [Planctomyces sp. SH-PL62]AMV37923.1 DNA utilization protein GntX [Planctomyces sp. SH-PL62]